MRFRRTKKPEIVWDRYGFKNLLVWLLVYLVVGPFVDSLPHAGWIVGVFLSAVLLSAISAVNREKGVLAIAFILMVSTLVVMWLEESGLLSISPLVQSGLIAFYMGTLTHSYLRHLLHVRKVNSNVICAALCLYLILGIFWGALYQILHVLSPDALAGGLLTPEMDPGKRIHVLNYFSFVTLSTLGYGDITPQTQAAASLCQTEAILGQFLTVALVARLVGIEVSQEASNDNGKEE